MTRYLIFIGTIAGIYALLSLGLVMAWGQGGMVNLGLVGFFGLGAYTLGAAVGAGVPIGLAGSRPLPCPRAVGVAFCLGRPNAAAATIWRSSPSGFAEILRLVETNEKWLTRGSDGISGIRAPFKDDLGGSYPWFYLVLTWALVAVAVFLLARLLRARSAGRCARCATTSRSRPSPASRCSA